MNLFILGFVYFSISQTKTKHFCLKEMKNNTKNNDCALIPKKDIPKCDPIWPVKKY